MDRDRVLAWFESGQLLRPDPMLPSTVSLAHALAALTGAPTQLDSAAMQVCDAIGEAEHLILVLADGLGLDLVQALPADSFLRSHLAMELRSVFPSSTAPALTSLSTGLWPAQHGLLGWFAYLPERGIHVITLPFRERFSSRSLTTLAVTGRQLFDWPASQDKHQRSVRMLMPEAIADSEYTRRISNGAAIDGYRELELAAERLIAHFARPQPSSYTYFYYPRIDSVSHDHGPASATVRSAVETLDRVLSRLHEGLQGKARIVVSADHGAIEVPASRKVVVSPDDRAAVMLRTPPSGEPRAPLFHVKAGAQDDFAEAFRSQFGEQFALLPAEQVIDLQLLGPEPPSATARARMGDFLALSGTGDALVFASDQGIMEMIGFHGGLDPREVRIPLIVA